MELEQFFDELQVERLDKPQTPDATGSRQLSLLLLVTRHVLTQHRPCGLIAGLSPAERALCGVPLALTRRFLELCSRPLSEVLEVLTRSGSTAVSSGTPVKRVRPYTTSSAAPSQASAPLSSLIPLFLALQVHV
jgi:hypothetical protein